MKRMVLSIAVAALAASALSLPVSADGRGRTTRFELVEATVLQMQEALSSGLLTSEQLVRMYLARIAAYDDVGPRLNAFLLVNPRAVSEARRLDRIRKDGHDDRDFDDDGDDNRDRRRSPLFGIPVLLKDNVDTTDMPTTAGSVALEGSRPSNDAFIARRLRRAGAIILGKATLTEFANFIAIGMPSGFSSLSRKLSGDPARGGYGFNPYDVRTDPRVGPPNLNDGRPALTPGGSSSGSGIGVAANLVAVSIGTETSGSILSPGSANMDVGIKPTVGLVSRDGIIPITADQDTAGPITRTVTDAAIVLGEIAGFDRNDPATAACRTPGNCFRDYTRFLDKHALRGARIAVPPFPANRADIMNPAIAVLRDQGATVELVPALAPQLGICVSVPAPADCSTVLLYGQKRDLNNYLASTPRRPKGINTIADIVAFNAAFNPPMKYGQAIFEAAASLDTSPGSADTLRYFSDLAEDRRRSRAAIEDVLDGTDNTKGTADDFDAILFSANSGAGTPAKAGYPSITVPGGFSAPAINAETGQPLTNPVPSGVTFSATAFSEPTLIGLAYAFEQATKHRVPPASAPPLPSDTVVRRR